MRLLLLLSFVLLFRGAQARTGFTLLPPAQSGVTFTNQLPESRHLTNQILLNGSGVAAGDVDGDGRVDLYFTSLDGPNALYRNLGDWRFAEIADQAGVALSGMLSTGCALVDFDGDGDLDLVVNSLGRGTRIFHNDGKGVFRAHPQVLNPGKGGMSVGVGDLNGDGLLDLYIANYRTLGLMDIPNARADFKRVDGKLMVERFNGRPATAPDLTNRFSVGPLGGIEEHGEADVIYRNIGGTNFVPLSWTSGDFLDEEGRPMASEPYDWGLAAMIRDIDGDNLPDIYVCNDFLTPDRFWINQGGGKFRLLKSEAQRKSSLFSMSVDFADLNRDGFDDFLVADMLSRSHSQRMRDLLDNTLPELFARPQYSLNTLFLNRGDHTYAEVSRYSGLEASDWSWSCVFLDVDLDGWEDVLFSNGMERAARDLDIASRLKEMRAARKMSDAEVFQARRMFPRLAPANLAFRNRGDLTFQETGDTWGFNLPGVSHGLALADLDNDGDLDLALNNLNAPASLYRNETDAPRIAIRLKGARPNTRAIGAKIIVRHGAAPFQSQSVIAGGRYLSSDDPIRSFAAGQSTNLGIEVFWPSGRRTEIPSATPSALLVLEEPVDTPIPLRTPPVALNTLFDDVSTKIPFDHSEADFDDYARQPLLPKKLSQPGPGAAWYDLDGDAWDELIIGNGRAGRIAAFRNMRNGSFQPIESVAIKPPLNRDVTAVLGWRGSPGRGYVLAAFSNYEDGQTNGGAVKQLDLMGGSTVDIVAASESSAGPLALADIDGDGDLDLFVGGSLVAGKYPSAASSRLFRNQGGRLILDSTNQPVFTAIGMVNGAVFSDVDNDKDPDLIVTREWGSPGILINDRGIFMDRTREHGLSSHRGWWTGIATGDFDEDGRMDIVAGNWGLNTRPKPSDEQPLRLYHGDLDEDGTYDVVESHFDEGVKTYVPARQWSALGKSLSFVRQGFPSNEAYSTAGIERVLGGFLSKSRIAEANFLASSIFLNRGDRFEIRALPAEAQFAPVFGVAVADFDGDGHEDLVLAQNFFPVQPEVPRQDSGRGLLLRGDGRGFFRAAPGHESGLRVYGEQRAIAVSDYDADGRPDLLITQNQAAARLYRNTLGKPAVRVLLEGAAANPDALGASLQFISDGRRGPRREIQSSSGWLSQNSRIQLIHAPGAGELEVRWPDGLEERIGIPAGVKQVRLRRDAPASPK